jgi:uncharacterized damage-inducible protein DinB
MDNHLHKLWLYNDWANITLLDSLLLQQKHFTIPPKTIKLFSHMMTAQTIWLERLKRVKPSIGVWEAFDLETCKHMHELSSAGIKQLLAQPELELQQTFAYTNTQGDSFENQIEDILLHIFNHGTYHRGQIAQDLRLNGLEPINTDYISFVRR